MCTYFKLNKINVSRFMPTIGTKKKSNNVYAVLNFKIVGIFVYILCQYIKTKIVLNIKQKYFILKGK